MKNELFYGFSEADLTGYVNGKLSKDTLQAMETAIQQYPEFKTALMERIHLDRIRKHPVSLLLLHEMKQPPTILGMPKPTFIKTAAALVLAATLTTGAVMYKQYRFEEQELNTHLFVKKILNEKPNRDVYNSDLKKIGNRELAIALKYYRNHEYVEAENRFVSLRPQLDAPEAEEIGLYIATCRLKRNDYEGAKNILQPLLDENIQTMDNEHFLNAIYWHLALANLADKQHVKKGDAAARKYLQSIPKGDEHYHPAQDLLNRMAL
jgi:hypothetical protein